MNSKRLFAKLFVLLICVTFVFAKTGSSNNKVVTCFLMSLTADLPSKGAYTIENVDPNLCTHVIYGFAVINETTNDLVPEDFRLDITEKGYERAVGLKKKNPHLKVTLSIGGNFSRMAADPSLRSHFVNSATDIALIFKFDGLDIYWTGLERREGKQNFVLLCKELKESLEKHKLILTANFVSDISLIDVSYDVRGLNKYLDYLHIMAFDYSSKQPGHIAPDAPLDNNGGHCVNQTIQHLIKLGVSPSKIILGIPFMARTFITNGTGHYGDISMGGFAGPYTRTKGFMGYNELCELLSNHTLGWNTTFDQPTSQSIARRSGVAKNETWVAVYDSTESVIKKVRYATSQHLAGVEVIISAFDDFRGTCEGHKTYPLLRAINQAMAESEVTSVKSVFSLYFSSKSYRQ